jgi:hypothetical protein
VAGVIELGLKFCIGVSDDLERLDHSVIRIVRPRNPDEFARRRVEDVRRAHWDVLVQLRAPRLERLALGVQRFLQLLLLRDHPWVPRALRADIKNGVVNFLDPIVKLLERGLGTSLPR